MNASRSGGQIGLLLMLCLTGAALASTQQMTACVIQGGLPVLKSVPRPDPGAGQVRIRVQATSVNPADWKRAARAPDSGAIPGWDIAGTIDAVGSGVRDLRVGEPVIAFFEGSGGYAQFAVADVSNVAPAPRSLSTQQAAGIPLAAVTAWKALIDVAGLQSGQRVLILGGAGGVGTAAIQIAAARGAKVTATASASSEAELKRLGAEQSVDYHTPGYLQTLHGFDLVINTVDADTASQALTTLKPNGILVSVAGAVAAESCTTAGIRCGSVDRKLGTPIRDILRQVASQADAGHYTVEIDSTLPLSEAAKAWDMNRQGHTHGKIILSVP